MFVLILKLKKALQYEPSQISKYNMVHDNKLKYYRYKKRYSFETPDSLYRIDLTVVKSTQYDFKTRQYKLTNTFKESNILNNPETYELEIEFIGKDNNEYEIPRILDYYNKLEKDIKNPLHKSIEHVYDPLTMTLESVWKSSVESEPDDFKFMESTIIDVPKQEMTELHHILVGNNVKVTSEFKHESDIDLTDKEFLVIDYFENYNEKGKHVHLVSNDNSLEKQ